MAGPSSSEDHLRAHPLLSQLLEAGPGVRAFRGYVGPQSDGERLRLYPSLGDLGFSIEINRNDVLASAPAPQTLLPHGGTVVWVRPEAEVVCRGDRVATVVARRGRQTAPGGLAAGLAGAPVTNGAGLVEVQAGRLRIQLRQRVMSSCASCSCSSCETHPSCTSNCNEVVAAPSVVLGP